MPDHRRAKREHVTIGYDEGGTDVKRQQTSADGQIDTGILPSDALGIGSLYAGGQTAPKAHIH